MQIEAEGLIANSRYLEAIGCLERAVEAGEAALEQAETRAGRLERIFELRDSWTLMAYCQLECGNIPAAVEALDRGKSRLWRSQASPASFVSLGTLIPPGGALLFPVFAAAKGAVVVVSASGATTVWLADFGRRELQWILTGNPAGGALGGWLSAYLLRNSQPVAWLEQIDSIGSELYRHIWAPVLEALSSLGVEHGAELVWFPQGGSGILPLHAAWKPHEGGRNWIVADYAIRYASSIHALLSALQSTTDTRTSLLVSNPTGNLDFSSIEMAWVTQVLDNAEETVLAGEAATKPAIMAALPACSLAHFSTHAAFSLADPFQSSLLVAAAERLTLDELLPVLRTSPPASVVLSACETGMARVTTSVDEMLGFASAFLENGVRNVLASLWPVEDSATAALIGRYYREWRKEGKSPAQALREAQNWLRAVTVRELMQLLKEMKTDPGLAGAQAARVRSALRGVDPETCIYAHPFFWAAFTVSGL